MRFLFPALTLISALTLGKSTVVSQSGGANVEITEASVADLQRAMAEGRTTSRAIVQAYLDRIAAFDKSGPKLNSILTVNDDALKEAEEFDRERAEKGPWTFARNTRNSERQF